MSILLLLHTISLIASSISLGSLLFYISLQSILDESLHRAQLSSLWRRYYTLNSLLCLIAAITSILATDKQTGGYFAILAASHIFSHTHLARGIHKLEYESQNAEPGSESQQQSLRAFSIMKKIHAMMHIIQLIALIYLIGRLAIYTQTLR